MMTKHHIRHHIKHHIISIFVCNSLSLRFFHFLFLFIAGSYSLALILNWFSFPPPNHQFDHTAIFFPLLKSLQCRVELSQWGAWHGLVNVGVLVSQFNQTFLLRLWWSDMSRHHHGSRVLCFVASHYYFSHSSQRNPWFRGHDVMLKVLALVVVVVCCVGKRHSFQTWSPQVKAQCAIG